VGALRQEMACGADLSVRDLLHIATRSFPDMREPLDHDGIAAPEARAAARGMVEQSSIPASAIAEAIGFAISQPENVDVNELIVRPTAQG
jgi:NADP-dependent 3-hydroxy acid dehydrogenase YdfG